MKETVTDPLLFFLASILFGVCLQAIYDKRVFVYRRYRIWNIYSSDGIYISLYI